MGEDDCKATIKKTFVICGEEEFFTFKEGDRYLVDQDEYYVMLTDDCGKVHYLSYTQAEKHLE